MIKDYQEAVGETGAEFQRNVGADPERWASRFLDAYARAEGLAEDDDRLLFVAGWFRDAMEAAVKHAPQTMSEILEEPHATTPNPPTDAR